MAIKVNFTIMQNQITNAKNSYDELNSTLAAADAARNAAVLASGGTTTAVGSAIDGVLGDVLNNRLNEAKVLIEELSAQIEEYKKTYSSANDDLVSFINSLKASDDNNAPVQTTE